MGPVLRHIDYEKVEDMVEGDDEFRTQLFQAILVAVKELRDTYSKGIIQKDPDLIRQARHKIKPTLFLFGLEAINRTLSEGKRLIASDGLDQDLSEHLDKFMQNTQDLMEEVENNL
ncbi:MAG: hypothetical protein JJU34_05155 [Lunatimonas sp.]|uniref:hypothetical protein n=1 Tax=Lunatimonas sp. TaxID=2060141 RepID=UPI00263B0AAC|nr:hypothetical protein [Lunatimonas sp.]MCC5936648.1 hypothetical protein [Lunatimonas sp.]